MKESALLKVKNRELLVYSGLSILFARSDNKAIRFEKCDAFDLIIKGNGSCIIKNSWIAERVLDRPDGHNIDRVPNPSSGGKPLAVSAACEARMKNVRRLSLNSFGQTLTRLGNFNINAAVVMRTMHKDFTAIR